MMFTITSRKTGQRFDFRMPDFEGWNQGYITVSIDGSEPRQPCHGGWFMGSTVLATSDTFESVCRKWYRAYMRGDD